MCLEVIFGELFKNVKFGTLLVQIQTINGDYI